MKTCYLYIILLPLVLLVSCYVDEVGRIRDTLTSLQASVENRQPREFASYLAEGFEDQQGRNAQAIRGYLAGLFLRNASIHVFIANVDIRLDGDTATSSCLVTVTGGQGLIPERMRRIVLLLEWRKDAGNWKVYRANWHEPEGL